jgi:hypothetical protein
MKKLLLPIITVCCLAPVAVFAGQQHPLITDMAQTVAPSKFEAETAVEYHSYDSASVFVLQETVTGGIIPKLDAFITLPFLSVNPDASGADTESGLSDVTVGVKYNFMNVNKTALSVKPFLVLPVGDENKGLGEGGVGIGAVAIASIELDKQITIDANLMLKHQEQDHDSYNEFGLSVAGKYLASRDVKMVAELALSNSDAPGSDLQAIVTAGAIIAVQKNIDVDCGLRVGLTDDSEDYALLAGVTFKF